MKHFGLQNCLIVSRSNFFMKNTQYFAFDADIINRNGLFNMDTIMIQDVIRIQDKLQEKIDSYSDMLYKIAYARMGNRADAEDIVQETFY